MLTKKAFTLVELIIVVTILAILWTISFIALQWFSQDAKDSKRISDTRSLISKITIENIKWTSYSDIINETWKETNTLKINWTSQTGTQNRDNPINRNILKENEENFRDPTNNHPYPFAYATWETNWQLYNFIQLAYVEEKTGWTKLVWNYYEMLPWDSPSLFTNGNWSWVNIPTDYITDNWEPIYNIWVTYTPTPIYVNCEEEKNWYNIPATNHWETTEILTKTWALSWWGGNWYSNYSQSFTCDNWTFIPNWENENAPTCDENHIPQWTTWSYTCVPDQCQWNIPEHAISNVTSQSYGVSWTYNTSPWVCTYKAWEGYHTEDNGATFMENTRSCTITNWIWQQTRNETSRWNCEITSCNGWYTLQANNCVQNSCASYTSWNWTFTVWIPTTPNTPWQITSSSSPCYVACNAWYYYQDSSCIEVWIGYYSASGVSTRTACHTNSSTSWTKSSSQSQCLCNAGYYYASTTNVCTEVWIGYYSLALNNNRTKCSNWYTTNTTTSSSSSDCIIIIPDWIDQNWLIWQAPSPAYNNWNRMYWAGTGCVTTYSWTRVVWDACSQYRQPVWNGSEYSYPNWLTADDYPAFKYCRSFWWKRRLPTVAEYISIKHSDYSNYSDMNPFLHPTITPWYWYRTSEEVDDTHIYFMNNYSASSLNKNQHPRRVFCVRSPD
jgi:prepilin-type N-terminal cleavage/methylation domain-containing protein